MRGCAQKWRSTMSMIGSRSSSEQNVHFSDLSSVFFSDLPLVGWLLLLVVLLAGLDDEFLVEGGGSEEGA